MYVIQGNIHVQYKVTVWNSNMMVACTHLQSNHEMSSHNKFLDISCYSQVSCTFLVFHVRCGRQTEYELLLKLVSVNCLRNKINMLRLLP